MIRKFLFLVFIAFFFIVIIFIFRFVIIKNSSGQGILKVTTNTTCRVFLDNKDIGRTPLEQRVAVGEYSLRLVPEGMNGNLSSWQGNVKIGSNVLTYVNRELSESELTSAGETLWLEKIQGNRGELTVLAVPDGARITLNDESKGITPLTVSDLSDGDYRLIVSSPGFEQRSITIKITSGYKLIASLSLALSPGQMLLEDLSQFNQQESTTSSSLLNISPTKHLRISPTSISTPVVTLTKTPAPTKLTPSPTAKLSPTVSLKQPSLNVKKVEILDTPTGFLRVREDASTASSEIGRAKPGDKFSVLDVKDVGGITWYKIAFTETRDGWISGQYAKKIE